MSKKQNYTAPEVNSIEVKTEGVVMLSKNEVLSVLTMASIDEASSYAGDDEPIKW